jgi:hypothetical protein
VTMDETASADYSEDSIFRTLSPYLNSFVSGAVQGFGGYILGGRRDTPTLGIDGGGGPASIPGHRPMVSPSGAMYVPWLVFGIGILGLMFLFTRRS